MKNDFERFNKLSGHIARMASSGSTGSIAEWSDFLDELNQSLIQEKWVVHIIGPDDVINQLDELTALRAANDLNKMIDIAHKKPDDPFVIAVVKNSILEEV